jgi:predicted RNA-binding Zn-ribbon protein involved in translation (DUF1610 family)
VENDREKTQDPTRVVQFCPWCGESIGSFWGRRGADGSYWCESCATFFAVEERAE